MDDLFCVDRLNKEDYYKNFLQLLEQLTVVDANELNYENFCERFDEMNSHTFVVRNNSQDKVIATASVFIEKKFIHRLGKVGHIEDVVVDKEYRDKGLGKLIVDHCREYALNEHGCYKISLNCSENNIPFYEKCGFKQKGNQMSFYKLSF